MSRSTRSSLSSSLPLLSPQFPSTEALPSSSPSHSSTKRRVAYVVSNELAKISSLLPSNRGRSMLVHQLVLACGLLRPQVQNEATGEDSEVTVETLKPVPATKEELLQFHGEEYLDYVLSSSPDPSNGAEFGIEDDCPYFPGLHLYVPYIAGSALTAAKALIDGRADVAIAWDGGRHHAQKSVATGFCYVGDLPLALMTLKRSPSRPRVMYLDFDLHYPDGVSPPFHNPHSTSPSRLLTFSIHHAAPGFYPPHPLASLTPEETSDPYTLSLPLKRGASNQTFKRIWSTVERVKEAFDPQYVVLQCGLDGLAGDRCAVWNWGLYGEGGVGWLMERVMDWTKEGVKVLLVGGGGYHDTNAARGWAYLTSIAVGRPLLPDSPIPEHSLWPKYAPSFTFEHGVGGRTKDKNDDEYLAEVERVFTVLAERVRSEGGKKEDR